jgi:pyruvate formate lyase activating enzyme
MLRDVRCIRCGNCVQACPQGASQIIDSRRVIDFNRCNQCMLCVNVCSSHAIEAVGQWKSVPELIDIIVRDEPYYEATNGGLTISGGEPLQQWQFARELARAAQAVGIHIALDTTGYASWKSLFAVMQHIDLVLYDLKQMDATVHRQFTGVQNTVILKNLRAIMGETKATVWIRIPVIPEFNNSEKALVAIGEFIQTLPRPIEKISLLPFHQFGAAKYSALGRPYRWSDKCVDPEDKIESLMHKLAELGFKVELGR